MVLPKAIVIEIWLNIKRRHVEVNCSAVCRLHLYYFFDFERRY